MKVWTSQLIKWVLTVWNKSGSFSFICVLQEVKQTVYSLIVKTSYLPFFDSRQQNSSISLRLPAQLLLGRQWKWLGPPVQQQQLPGRPW